jgi:enoyl-CoA hydratase/carnithine racemase
MTIPHLLIERHGTVALLTLNERTTRNALSTLVIEAPASFLKNANDDESLSCIVLTGAGERF